MTEQGSTASPTSDTGPASPVSPASPASPASPVIRRWQIGLIGVGILGLLLGAVVLIQDVEPKDYPGLAVWFLAALIIHDGIIAAGVVAVQIAMRKIGARVPLAVIAILQGAVVVGAIMSLIVFPEVYKSGIGTNNPTVLPLDYVQNLVWFYLAIAVLTALAIIGYLLARRQKLRSSSSHA